MNKIRSANLRLLRHGVFDTDQIHFAETVKISQSKLSELERGKVTFDDSLVRSIENGFELPSGWMDRDNSGFFLTSEEYELIKNIRALKPEQQNTVVNLLEGVTKLVSTKPKQ